MKRKHMKLLQMIPLIPMGALLVLATACSQPATESPVDNAPSETSHQTDSHKHHTESQHDDHSHMAHDHNHDGLFLKSGMAKPSVPGQKVSAAYVTLVNPTDQAIQVNAISSDVAENTEFHTMKMEGSKMVMRQLEDVSIPAQGELVLRPGGDHIMLMQLHKPLQLGDQVNMTLELSNGESFSMTVPVKTSEKQAESAQMMHHHDHAGH